MSGSATSISSNPSQRRRTLLVGILLLPGLLAAPSSPAAEITFNRDIRPLLSENCYSCHGPDKNARKGKLRLDIATEATATREGRRAIAPGHPEQSEVMKRLRAASPDDLMPPPESHKRLSPEQIALIGDWITQGARYEGHWAFTPPQRPSLPASVTPSASSGGKPIHPIDAFIRARLPAAGLKPSPPADRRTLIRRLSLDLTGLPPTPEAVARFVGSRDPEAYPKLVEEYLASPATAERLAVHWLDWVRYADTIGFHGDCDFMVWPYRDYVLRSFRDNLPFDRFTREQLAGDLLPNATTEQHIASGYNRLLRISTEGGAQDKEYLAKYAADRVRTTAGVWLGVTMGCAECHDHKFDPFTTRDFYSFAAFFADLKERGFYADGFSANDWGPKLRLPQPEQQARLDQLEAQIGKLKQQLANVPESELAADRQTWEQQVLALDRSQSLEWKPQAPSVARSVNGTLLSVGKDQTVTAGGPAPDNDTYAVEFRPGPGEWRALKLDILTDEMFPGNRIARAGTTFVVTEVKLRVTTASGTEEVRFERAVADSDGEGFPALAMLDERDDTGWAITSGHSREHQAVFHLAKPLTTAADTQLTFEIHQDSSRRRATIGRFRLSVHPLDQASSEAKGLPEAVIQALRTSAEQRKDDQRKLLADYHRGRASTLAPLRRELAQQEAERNLLQARIPSTLVSEALEKPRTMRVLPRGNWMDDSGPEVTPAVPAFLSKAGSNRRRPTRLDLADWITAEENPLTARSFVNRLWKMCFGTGFTRTPEDLGAQGEWPSHPELLDWLACEFRQPLFLVPRVDRSTRQGSEPGLGRWNVKHLLALIVTSETYQQASVSRPELDEKDPNNRLFARQGRFRLEAELVRDNALAIAGLLVQEFGGPSVKPYQPEGYYLPLNFPKREYQHDRGSNLYRRGLYTHWQRTFLHPSLVAFDASSREECTVNRPNSSTPLQALVLLNDPTYVEAARALAQGALREGGRGFTSRVRWIFTRALARPPRADEERVLRDLHRSQLQRFQADPEQARELLLTGDTPTATTIPAPELAAWMAVTRTVLNLHETITRF